jgi:predicted dehydrogenase/aryl-alcohol dehydrogenase-like predicted oxidoreductase
MEKLRWGVLSTGIIARVFAKGVEHSELGTLKAVASRDLEKSKAFAYGFTGCEPHGHYQDLLDDPNVDAIYIGTPHPQHVEWVIRAARAGKHILCEKPLGINHAEVMAMLDAAREHRVFLMEAFMYRCHPQTRLIAELIRDGAIGEIAHIEASFGFSAPVDPSHRLLNPALAGGGILDVGCYPISMARMIAGSALGKEVAEPEILHGHGRIGQTGVDVWASAQLQFPNGLTAQVSTGVEVAMDNDVTIHGREGRLHVPQPWHVSGVRAGNWELHLQRGDKTEVLSHREPNGLYTLEADEVARCIFDGALESKAMSWADSQGNSLALDAWRKDLALEYPAETAKGFSRKTLAGAPLRAPDVVPPRTGQIAGLEKPVSRLVMGCDNPPNLSHMSAMLDAYYELGGNTFDNAYIYGGGLSEKLLGRWLDIRGVRSDCVLIGKGAHTPHNFPHFIGRQLDKSLDRLKTDYVDVYFLHRDNLDVPVGEFVDALDDEAKRGRIRTFGGSNWTLARFREANEYAAANGKQGFSVLSNNFALARMNRPVWPGVESCSDDSFRHYLEENQVTLMPWSSQARGFFAPWGAQMLAEEESESGLGTGTFANPDRAELIRVWSSPENLERRRRAETLATARGVDLMHVALAYVFSQAFPVFPLIGPRNYAELRGCWQALSLDLDQAEVEWLDLRSTVAPTGC